MRLESEVWGLARVRELRLMGGTENRSTDHRKHHLFPLLFPSLSKQFGPDALVGDREVREEVGDAPRIKSKGGRRVSFAHITTCQLRLSCHFPCLQSREVVKVLVRHLSG